MTLTDTLADYLAAAELAKSLGAWPVESDDPGMLAMAYAVHGWKVFPLRPRSKQPIIPNAHPEGDPLRGKCTGECGRFGHGFHDATTDPVQVVKWWGMEYPGAGIAWVPDWEQVVVLDLDRHKEGQDGIARFKSLTGTEYPDTMVVRSGGGGLHVFYRRPMGRLTSLGLDKRFGKGHGVDVRTNGYLLAPGTLHPDTGRPYQVEMAPIAPMPYTLSRVLIEQERPKAPPREYTQSANSIADWFSAHGTWAMVLEPHGWSLAGGDGDSHGSLWRHPSATAPHSAMVDEHGQLHVFSPNTPLQQSGGRGSGTGYTRFRAFAELYCSGDMTKAALLLLDFRNRPK